MRELPLARRTLRFDAVLTINALQRAVSRPLLTALQVSFCHWPVPKHFNSGFLSFAHATYTFEGGKQLTTESVRSCRARK